MSRNLYQDSSVTFKQITRFQTISTASTSCQIQISENFDFQNSVSNGEILQQQQVFAKHSAKIDNNESTFQLFRPKGDLQPARDEEEEAMLKKYKIYSQLLEPLKGQSLYSIDTFKLKLQMDLLILEQFDKSNYPF